jgi:hypothetical protein
VRQYITPEAFGCDTIGVLHPAMRRLVVSDDVAAFPVIFVNAARAVLGIGRSTETKQNNFMSFLRGEGIDT